MRQLVGGREREGTKLKCGTEKKKGIFWWQVKSKKIESEILKELGVSDYIGQVFVFCAKGINVSIYMMEHVLGLSGLDGTEDVSSSKEVSCFTDSWLRLRGCAGLVSD